MTSTTATIEVDQGSRGPLAGRGGTPRRVLWALVGLGAAAVPLYALAARLGDLLAHLFAFATLYVALCALYAVACRLVTRDGGQLIAGRGALVVIALFALIYRLILVPAVPSLSDDFFRYVWDGHVQGLGYSPYRYPPRSPELVPLRDDFFWPRINRKEQTSAYPPFAELVYRALALIRPLNMPVFKLAFLSFDLATIMLLGLLLRRRGQPPSLVLLYAWHPLVPFEFIASAHIDVLAVLLLVAALVLQARGRPVAAGVALGLATLTKLYPGLLLPAFCRRGQWRLPLATALTVVVGFLPSLVTGDSNFRQFPTYLNEEGYDNGDRFFPLKLLRPLLPVPTTAYIAAVALALLGLSLWLWAGPLPGGALDVPRRALLLATAIMLLVTPSYPWYFLWLLPLIAVAPAAGPLYLLSAVPLTYLPWNWPGERPASLATLVLLFLAGVYVPAYALLLWPRLRARLGRPARQSPAAERETS